MPLLNSHSNFRRKFPERNSFTIQMEEKSSPDLPIEAIAGVADGEVREGDQGSPETSSFKSSFVGEQHIKNYFGFVNEPPAMLQRDPTSPLELGLDHLLLYKSQTVARSDDLERRGVVVVASSHLGFSRSVGLSLAKQHLLDRPEWQARQWVVAEEEAGLMNALAKEGGLIGESGPSKKDGGKKTLVLITFLGSSPLDGGAITALERLLNSPQPGRAYIVLIPSSRLEGRSFGRFVRLINPWKLESCAEVLDALDLDESDRTRIEEALALGKQEQTWPDREPDLGEEVAGILAEGGWNALERELARKDRPRVGAPLEEARKLFQNSHLLGRTALTLASHFPGLTIGQFESALKLALGEDMLELPPPQALLADGKAAPKRTVRAWDHWLEEHLDLAPALGLAIPEAHSLQDTEACLRFIEPRMEQAVRQTVPVTFLRKCLKRLHDGSLFANPETPKRLADTLMTATLPLFTGFEDEFDHRWLNRQLDSLRQVEAVMLQLTDEVKKMGNSPQSSDLLDALEGSKRTWFDTVLRRLAGLCVGLLNSGRVSTVNQFLHSLEKSNSIVALLWRLAKVCGDDSIFDVFWWAKHLLDSGNAEIRGRVMGLLADLGAVSTNDFWRVMKKLREWHPPGDWQPGPHPLQGSQLWSLCFVYAQFLTEKAGRESSERAGKAPPCPLTFQDDGETLPREDRVLLLADWLTHPALPHAIERSLEESGYHPRWDFDEGDHPRDLKESIQRDWNGETPPNPTIPLGQACIVQILEGWNHHVLATTAFPLAQAALLVKSLRGEERAAAEVILGKNRALHEKALEGTIVNDIAVAISAKLGEPQSRLPLTSAKTLRRGLRWFGNLWSDHSRLAETTSKIHAFRERRQAAYLLGDTICPPVEN